MITKYLKFGDTFKLTDSNNLIVSETLPVGTYTIGFDKLSEQYFLKLIEDYNIGKLYGNIEAKANKIINTFLDRKASTGVLLSGEKGTGKTLLAKVIANLAAKQGISTIVINNNFCGEMFNRFIQSINQACIIIFDEFEKNFRDNSDQEALLTLLDGVYPTHKLFILTTNDTYAVNRHMINRPGRLFYHIEHNGLEENFITDYCNNNLKNTSEITRIISISKIFDNFTFDMLKALVEEMNRYNESAAKAIELMNIKPHTVERYFTYELYKDGVKVLGPTFISCEPFKGLTVWYDETPDDDNSDPNLRFLPTQIVSVNKGDYVFVKDKFKLFLNKVVNKTPDFFNL